VEAGLDACDDELLLEGEFEEALVELGDELDGELDDELEGGLGIEVLDCCDSGGLHAVTANISRVSAGIANMLFMCRIIFQGSFRLVYSNLYNILTFSVIVGLPFSSLGRNGVVIILSLAIR